MTTSQILPESFGEFPNLSGTEHDVSQDATGTAPVFLRDSGIDFDRIDGAFGIALHMHQPLIPAGGGDLHTAAVISNLQFMMEHPEVQDAHNAPVFLDCYRRMGDLIPQLLREGAQPRIMLDYSGCLLHGLQQMGASHVIDALKALAQDHNYRRCVEWLGTAWGHAVAPSTPVQDFRLHVLAWQSHFASIFGSEALSRVKGFSPPEMALPNHPDVCYEFVKTLKECGYRWVLIQEHSVERIEDGGAIRNPHVPHRLVARNSNGQTVSIVALIKTQGSDTKLVGQMQPYYDAKGLKKMELGGRSVPQLSVQISDGENGGVMMNEFVPKFLQVMHEAANSRIPAMNGTEYLEHLEAAGVREEHLPVVQPVHQKRIWDLLENAAGPEKLEMLIEQLRKEDHRFNMDGGSWTDNISWVNGYEGVLTPMRQASALFAEKMTRRNVSTTDPAYRTALFHLLLSQTSCFRYWGEGTWGDYGREFCRRTIDAMA